MHLLEKDEFVSTINELWIICGGERGGGSKKLADLVGVHYTTIDRWKKGTVDFEKMSVGQMRRIIKVAEDIRARVAAAMGTEKKKKAG